MKHSWIKVYSWSALISPEVGKFSTYLVQKTAEFGKVDVVINYEMKYKPSMNVIQKEFFYLGAKKQIHFFLITEAVTVSKGKTSRHCYIGTVTHNKVYIIEDHLKTLKLSNL